METVNLCQLLSTFEDFWTQFNDHVLCTSPVSKLGLRCLFCQIRSFSLRVNRAKIRQPMRPVELFSQMDQLTSTESKTNFTDFFNEILNLVINYEAKLASAIFGKEESCIMCSSKVSLQNSFSKIKSETNIKNIPTIEDMMEGCMDKARKVHTKETKCNILKLKPPKLNQLIVLTFEDPTHVKLSPRITCSVGQFKLLCFVARNESKCGSLEVSERIVMLEVREKLGRIW